MRPISILASLCLTLSLCPAATIAQQTAAPAAISQRALFDEAADYSSEYSGRAMLVMHKGVVLHERYDNDWTSTRPHMLASGTKSFTGVVAMFAVQDGLLTLDETVADTITEWKSDARKREITVRHLLTLSSGLDPADAAFPTRAERAGLRGQRNEVTDARSRRIEREDARTGVSKLATGDWFKDAVSVPATHDAGTQFEYGPSHFYAFGELMNRKLSAQEKIVARSFEDYAKLRVFEPLGIKIGRWGKDEAGNVNMPGGMMLTAREWAKFGQFVLQRGAWKQPDGTMKQLLKPELLAQCFEPSATNSTYGLTWWLGGSASVADGAAPQDDNKAPGTQVRDRAIEEAADTRVAINGKDTPVYMAAGLGKQRLFILPELELVVVRFAEPSRKGMEFSNEDFLVPIVQAITK